DHRSNSKPESPSQLFMAETLKKSSGAVIFFAWLLFGVPLGWGVHSTVLNSLKLFQPPPVPPAPVASQYAREISLRKCLPGRRRPYAEPPAAAYSKSVSSRDATIRLDFFQEVPCQSHPTRA